MRTDIHVEIEIPDGVQVELKGRTLKVSGKKGTLERVFTYKLVELKVESGKIIIDSKNAGKREKTMFFTYRAHINNMLKGVSDGFIYKLKVVSTHFPMNVSLSNGELIVKNYFGEKNPRRLKLYEDVKVNVNGDEIIVEGIDKERVGQQAANIEQLTKITNRDRRVFQDGIYIIEKAGKSLVTE